ncbi:hypothetical protein BU26DRAFT_509785 [Trematosphaeria pertusa]|uniref:Uncharacterized protein n=1 Tax=Trematosphaeria pertusa TaxID=390896 RepID=A0A6A6HZQ6_9PLEO|nr:uncharacterized protein BU26DRAFT_509785 [Trematosphaeria pertusa]KAF2243238.1 hypothetical protein BU26DRAFT_509785 [Trematosphaeria pertusa]
MPSCMMICRASDTLQAAAVLLGAASGQIEGITVEVARQGADSSRLRLRLRLSVSAQAGGRDKEVPRCVRVQNLQLAGPGPCAQVQVHLPPRRVSALGTGGAARTGAEAAVGGGARSWGASQRVQRSANQRRPPPARAQQPAAACAPKPGP